MLKQFMLRAFRFANSRSSHLISRVRLKLYDGVVSARGARASRGLRLRVTDGGACVIGAGVSIERNVEITASPGVIEIGSNTFIGTGSMIVSKDKIVIGENCLIAEYVTIRDQNHKISLDSLIAESGFDAKPILIGRNVWIGAKASILAGVHIGPDSVIGAGSVVTKSVPPKSIAVGVPARIVRRI